MKELIDYRTQLIGKLVERAKDFHAACLAVTDPFAPLEEGGWNAHQVAAHTRDVDKMVYGLRAKRTALEDNPMFENFDGDKYTAEHYNADEPLKEMMDDFVNSVMELADVLGKLSKDAWARESRHATMGSGFTLQTWVEKSLAHIEEHIATVRSAR